MTPERARLAIGLLDLTDLSDDATEDGARQLCDRAVAAGVAAVCVWPAFVSTSVIRLAGTDVRVATVVNFPSGAETVEHVVAMTNTARAAGADEIDVVLPYRAMWAGDDAHAAAVLDGVREATGTGVVKVIIESGEQPDHSAVRAAARFAVDHGADFVKTSTGKTNTSATLDAAGTILGVIAAADRPVGLKVSGGVRTAVDADAYLDLVTQTMGADWIGPATFRFGASALLDALETAADDS